MNENLLTIRLLSEQDIPKIAQAFQELGWHKPAAQYQAYLVEQAWGDRVVFVAFAGEEFAGYVTIWKGVPRYPPFREQRIPEISDFNVLPRFRRHGIGSLLMEQAEAEAAVTSPVVGLGVGLTADYGAALRLYLQRGYLPDGHGLFYGDHHPEYGEIVSVDDDLCLYFTKDLTAS